MKTEYRAANGAQFSNEQAQKMGEVIQDLIDEEGKFEPEMLLALRNDPAFAGYFVSKDKAAELGWLQQCYHVATHILKVTRDPKTGEEHVTRAFHVALKISYDERKEKKVLLRVGYQDIQTIVDDGNESGVLIKVLKMLKSIRDRYSEYTYLSPIFKAIDEVCEEFEIEF